ncbi:aspartate--tRNA ligase [Candidatus Woesearchaeota archaeon]|nr:aspartate--tRNA ligase [Candidatus Woesearchaeota archaeon]
MLRTHTCGELTKKDVKKEVTLSGWVQSRRDHGGVIFIDLRDRYGLTQVVFDPSHNKDVHHKAEHIGREWVLQVTGHVRDRREGMVNPKLHTGEIEIITDALAILNEAETPPLEIEDRLPASEELRLKYRYLDLRRPIMQRHLKMRHEAMQAVREYLSSNSFMEIETPMLMRYTPGGARNFLVPARRHPGKFYALPESPQLFKQLLMVSGCDRYFQLARCLRDEDLRADRQPEFTQVDMELSFVDEQDIYNIIEGLLAHLFKKVLNKNVKTPFARLSYEDAMKRFGSDKPDLRFGLELADVGDVVAHSDFGVFKSVLDKKGVVYCLNAKGCGKFSRTEIEQLEAVAKEYHLPGLAWAKVGKNMTLESSIAKYFKPEIQHKLCVTLGAQEGDLLLFAANTFAKALTALGQVRLALGQKLGLIKDDEFAFCWVTEFPLFEWSEDEEKWIAMHHLFTMPKEVDLQYLETNPGKVHARQYDVVLNGTEIGGGSIRIHRKDIQERVLNVVGITYEEAARKFDFLLNAFRYGAPPHGGLALGFDRLVALMNGIQDIRECIAFPKNKAAENPMDGSPGDVAEKQLRELHVKVDILKKN